MQSLCTAYTLLKVNTTPNPLAKEELNLLARLMGGLEVQKTANVDSGFRVNLFATDEEEEWVLCFWYFVFINNLSQADSQVNLRKTWSGHILPQNQKTKMISYLDFLLIIITFLNEYELKVVHN